MALAEKAPSSGPSGPPPPFVSSRHFPLIGGIVLPLWRGKACGRLIAAPTRMQGRSCSPRRGRSQTGPRAHTVRPYGVCSAGANPGDWATARVAPTAKTGAFSKDGGRGKPLPYERNARFRVCAGEPLGAPAEMWAAFQEPTLIRHGFAVPPSPLEGEGLRAANSRPYSPPESSRGA